MNEGMNNKNESTIDKTGNSGIYVAWRIKHVRDIEEDFVQYETFGKCYHSYYVEPKKVLLYSKLDSQGKVTYYDAYTHEQVYISDLKLPLKGITNAAGIYHNIIVDNTLSYKTCFVTPFEKYIKRMFGRDIKNISLDKAKKILKLINLIPKKTLELSHEQEETEKELQKLGCDFKPAVDNKELTNEQEEVKKR